MQTLSRQQKVQRLYDDAHAANCSIISLLRRRQRQIFSSFRPDKLCLTATVSGVQWGTWTAMTVTNLQSLAIDTTDPYAGWQSARVDNQTSVQADDFEIQFLLSTAATAPANDKAVYAYIVPWSFDSSAWTPGANFSTTTRPTGTEGTCSITDPNSMKGPFPMPYIITSQPIDGLFSLSQFLASPPQGWSLAFRNNCGAALGTGCVVSYRSVKYTFA